MFKKLLIANRGEISCRVIKTAKKLGISTVAVYSDADANALHVSMADEALYLGASPAKESYLRGEHIIELAKSIDVDAIHPGYGFLSENATFARLCEKNNIAFVGPPVGAIEAMGSKSAAKTIMEKAGVPLVPGYHGDDQNPAIIKAAADDMGYPVLLKAAAGGGGKGMRQVWAEKEFDEALAAAKRESLSSFGDDTMLVEKYLTQPRHVEIQVFCDTHGNGVYLFERDCSVQRRHQKIIEEAPAPGMTEDLRKQMGDAALKAAKAINYVGAGTVEFLLDADGSFYFMEMNTRLQVEHPVTEMITGQDLVAWQLQVANGETLPLTQDQLSIRGHAFEARVYAEDPENDFLPATGTLTFLQPPAESRHVRVDTGVLQGDEVSVYYDPMIAKLIVWDEDRDKALFRMANALKEYRVNGLTTNLSFLYNLASSPSFQKAELDTGFIEKHREQLFFDEATDVSEQLPLMVLSLLLRKQALQKNQNNFDNASPWHSTNAWRMNEQHQQMIVVEVAGEQFSINITHMDAMQPNQFQMELDGKIVRVSGELKGEQLKANINGHRLSATFVVNDIDASLYMHNKAIHFKEILPDLGIDDAQDEAGGFTAPMNGTVIKLLASTNQELEAGTPLLIMEAMKMEHTIKAPVKGTVSEFYYQEGDLVDGGAELLSFTATE
ncbi:MAG: acetyl-CoA carboxylase biotin carboxylase subunit [Aestuariibacter sp.]